MYNTQSKILFPDEDDVEFNEDNTPDVAPEPKELVAVPEPNEPAVGAKALANTADIPIMANNIKPIIKPTNIKTNKLKKPPFTNPILTFLQPNAPVRIHPKNVMAIRTNIM